MVVLFRMMERRMRAMVENLDEPWLDNQCLLGGVFMNNATGFAFDVIVEEMKLC